jgi:hypothetical protein
LKWQFLCAKSIDKKGTKWEKKCSAGGWVNKTQRLVPSSFALLPETNVGCGGAKWSFAKIREVGSEGYILHGEKDSP